MCGNARAGKLTTGMLPAGAGTAISMGAAAMCACGNARPATPTTRGIAGTATTAAATMSLRGAARR